MNRTPISLEALRELANAYLETAKQSIITRGTLDPVIILVDALDSEPTAIIALSDPRILNDDGAKDGLTKFVRAQIAEHGYTASMFLTDSWTVVCTNEQEYAMYSRLRGMGVNSPQIVAMGVGTLAETIYVSVETLDGNGFTLSREYIRPADPQPNQPQAIMGEFKQANTIQGGRFKFFNREEVTA